MNVLLLAINSLLVIYFLPAVYMFLIFFIMGIVEFIDRLIKKIIKLVLIICDVILSFPIMFIGLTILLFRRNIL